MYLPRQQISQLYSELAKSTHPLSPPVLILTSLTVDALCSTRMLTTLLKRDYIPHKVQPVSGYTDLQQAGQELVLPLTRQRGGDGGVVVCLGVGGLVDLEEVLGLDVSSEENQSDMRDHGVEVWILDARIPWNLQNVFGSSVRHGDDTSVRRLGVNQGRIMPGYRSGKGGIIVWDDGDIESDLAAEKEAFMALQDMPEITEDDLLQGAESESEGEDDEPSSSQSRKRRASSQESDEGDNESDDESARKRRRSNSRTPIPSSPGGNPRSAQVIASTPPTFSSPRQSSPGAVVVSSFSPQKEPSARQLKRKLLKLRRKHESTLEAYYNLGTSYSEPVSSIVYSLASELGREDNDLLWLAIVGISSVELSPYCQTPSLGKSPGRRILDRAEQVREILRDEVRRLNPIPESELHRANDIIPTHARSPTDTAIRLSPEPRFLLIRHWSLYDSMLHSSYLATRLHVWSEGGRKRLHKLLAKMGISLQEAGKGYVHMDMELKRSLRSRILRFAEQYNLDGLVPGDDAGKEGWGFVRSWGWKATLSAADVSNIVGAILEVGVETNIFPEVKYDPHGKLAGSRTNLSYNARVRTLPTPPHSDDGQMAEITADAPDWTTARFFAAYDSLNPAATTSNTQGLAVLLQHIPTAQHLSRAILRTGSALISKKQIRHLRSFRMGVVKEGPDVSLFTHPGALVKLAAWLSEAVSVLDAEKGRKRKDSQEALVLAALDETRGVYVVVGLGGSGTNGKRPKSKAELREKEERRKRKHAARAAKKAERTRKREDRNRIRREINEANGILESDDEAEDSDGTESSASSGSDADSDDSDIDEDLADKRSQRGYGLNRFGQAFQEVVEETAARVRIDSFEHSVVEVRKEDLGGFLEALSLRSVVG